jgi:hypothetical protein
MGLLASAGIGGAMLACTGDRDESPEATQGDAGDEDQPRPESWSQASHSSETEPDYDVVFPKNKVQPLELSVTPENWQAMLDNMTSLFGQRGAGGGPGGFPGQPGAGGPGAGGPPAGGGPGGGFSAPNPTWAPATVRFNGRTWENVGLRFKGNSSLRSSWSGGTDKLPFKLDFDEFEDGHPEIKNQRFYGFKQLSLANNWGDQASMREALTYELLEELGMVAARTGFYEVVLDHGDGAQNLGLYTVIEVIDDTVIRREFKDPSGNIYEAEGPSASLARGTEGAIQASFEVESNESKANWSDIRELHSVLHSPTRVSDPGTWRATLESVFDVDVFLRWLAFSALIQHWDTYGAMTHNYYLYNDPGRDRLTWISWDHNLVMGAGGGGRAPAGNAPAGNPGGGGAGGRGNVPFDKSGVGENWPLINFLIAQAPYKAKYDAALRDIAQGAFEPSKVVARIRALAGVLSPYASRGIGEANYMSLVDTLAAIPAQRVEAAKAYLATL